MQKYEACIVGGGTGLYLQNTETGTLMSAGVPVYLAADVEAALKKLAAKWSDEIAVVYNEYSGGQRAGLTQAAAELRSLMGG